MNRTGIFRPLPVVSDAFWPYLLQRRQQIAAGIFPMHTPSNATQVPQETPRATVTRPTTGRAALPGQTRLSQQPGRGVTTAGAVDRGGAAPKLPAPNTARLTSQTTDVLPSASEVTNRPNLTGKVGPVPFRVRERTQSQALTAPVSVEPKQVGLNAPSRRASQAAVSATQTPDPGTHAAQVAVGRQLPSQETYRQRDVSAAVATDVMAEASIQTRGGRSASAAGAAEKEGTPVVKRRRLFRT